MRSPKGVYFALSARLALEIRSVLLRTIRTKIIKIYLLRVYGSFCHKSKQDEELGRRRIKYTARTNDKVLQRFYCKNLAGSALLNLRKITCCLKFLALL